MAEGYLKIQFKRKKEDENSFYCVIFNTLSMQCHSNECDSLVFRRKLCSHVIDLCVCHWIPVFGAMNSDIYMVRILR